MPLVVNGDDIWVKPVYPVPEPEPEPEPEPDIIVSDILDLEPEPVIYIYPDFSDIPHDIPEEYYVPQIYVPPADIVNDDNILDQPQTKSMGMTDNKIRRYLIDNVWIKHDMPIMAWDKFILSASWFNFSKRLAFMETLKKEMQNLARLPNGTIHTEEYDRCRRLAKNIDLIEEEFEDAPQFWIERFKDKIAGLTLAVKITIGVSIAVGVVFGLFVLYNYLKSYGTELGIKKARD